MAPSDPSDALVFFGMSGDLAHKKIFPALYAMVKKGELERAGHRRGVVAVDGRRPAQRGRATASPSTAAASTTRTRSSKLTGLMRYVDGDYNDQSTFTELQAEPRATARARRTTSPSRRACSRRSSRGSGRRACAKNARVIIEKPFGRDLASARHLNEVLHSVFPEQRHLPDRPLPRQGGDPEHPLLPVRQLVPRADLEPQLRAPGADHHGRGLRRAGPGQVLRGGRRAARRHREPPLPDGRAARDGAAGRSRGRGAARRQGARVRGDGHAQARRPRARSVRGLPRRGGRRARLRRRDLRRGAPAHRLVALGGRAVLRPRGQEPAGHVHRGAGRAAPPADERVRRVRAPRRTTRTTSASSSTRGSRSRPGCG